MSNRICPECKNIMDKNVIYGIEIDKCSKCEGIFFDYGELNKLIENMSYDENKYRGVKNGKFNKVHGENDYIICPKCNINMEEREYGYNSGTKIDWCNLCNELI